jgi:hypothetical protein
MADNSAVLKLIRRKPGVSYPVLTPNDKGFEEAVNAGAEGAQHALTHAACMISHSHTLTRRIRVRTEIAVFGAASEAFSKKNVNATIDESIRRFESVCKRALDAKIRVRGCVLDPVSSESACTYGAATAAMSRVRSGVRTREKSTLLLLAMWPRCCMIWAAMRFPWATLSVLELQVCVPYCKSALVSQSVGEMMRMLEAVMSAGIPRDRLAVHCHDTYGQALANIFAALQLGVGVVDASVAGLLVASLLASKRCADSTWRQDLVVARMRAARPVMWRLRTWCTCWMDCGYRMVRGRCLDWWVVSDVVLARRESAGADRDGGFYLLVSQAREWLQVCDGRGVAFWACVCSLSIPAGLREHCSKPRRHRRRAQLRCLPPGQHLHRDRVMRRRAGLERPVRRRDVCMCVCVCVCVWEIV